MSKWCCHIICIVLKSSLVYCSFINEYGTGLKSMSGTSSSVMAQGYWSAATYMAVRNIQTWLACLASPALNLPQVRRLRISVYKTSNLAKYKGSWWRCPTSLCEPAEHSFRFADGADAGSRLPVIWSQKLFTWQWPTQPRSRTSWDTL